MLADDAAVTDVVSRAGRPVGIAAQRRHPHLRRHAQRRLHPGAEKDACRCRADPDRNPDARPARKSSPRRRPAWCSAATRRASIAAGRCSTAIARRTFEAGTDPVAAAAIKIANNFVLGCAIEAMGEGFSLDPQIRRHARRYPCT